MTSLYTFGANFGSKFKFIGIDYGYLYYVRVIGLNNLGKK